MLCTITVRAGNKQNYIKKKKRRRVYFIWCVYRATGGYTTEKIIAQNFNAPKEIL